MITSRLLQATRAICAAALLLPSAAALLLPSAAALLLPSLATAADGPVIPLPAKDAKDLELLGKGVVGKAIPTPPLDDLIAWYMGDPSGGEWTYHVIKGKKKDTRVEIIKPAPDRGGQKAWTQKIGEQYLQYMQEYVDGSLGKYGELDLDLSYGTHFHPGIFLAPGLAPGKSFEVKQKALAYKMDKPNKTAYTGDMDVTLTYVGAYEVNTPAGTFPAILMRSEFDIRIGPAKVKDVMYSFFTKGVGKVAEIEELHVSALLIYQSHQKTSKVLADKPKR
jgi:hypothetical protein